MVNNIVCTTAFVLLYTPVEETLFGSMADLQLVVTVAVVGSSGCSILGIIKVTPPPPATLLEAAETVLLLVVVDALFLPFLATENTLVDLSAFF